MYKLILSVIICTLCTIDVSARDKAVVSYHAGYTHDKYIVQSASVEFTGFLLGVAYKMDGEVSAKMRKGSILGLDLGLRASNTFAYGFGVEYSHQPKESKKIGWRGFLQVDFLPKKDLTPVVRVDLSTKTGFGALLGLAVRL